MLIAQCTSCVCLIAAGRRNQRLRDFPLPLSLLFSSLEYRPRIGPPALITAPILAVLRVFLSVNRDELLIFRSIAAQFPPPPRSFRYRRYTRTFRSFIELFFLFALWRKEFDSKNGEIEIERFSMFSVLSEIGIGNG